MLMGLRVIDEVDILCRKIDGLGKMSEGWLNDRKRWRISTS